MFLKENIMDFVKLGIVGCGEAWRIHSNACKSNPKIKLMSIYDADKRKSKINAKKFKLTAFPTYEKFLNSDIDAILLMMPHYLHEEMVITAAEAGKHILCEKPMATTLEGCDKMIKATKKASVKFMIAENHRFLPAHKYIMEAVQNGLIGNVFLVRSYEGVNEIPALLDPKSWKGHLIMAGGGCLMDMGAHKFATLNWILNDEVESAYCWLTKQCTSLNEKAEDNAMIFLKYKNKVIAEIVVSFCVVTPPTNSLEIYGTKGTILENHAWKNPVKINSTHEDFGKNSGIWYEPKIEHGPYPKYYEISSRIEDSHFINCILEDKEPEFTPEQARSAISTILLGYLSAKMGKTANIEDLMEIYQTKGTKSIIEGLEHVIQNNYSR